eukprot:CAMPEP_0202447614 /NCGR_PEP_ID=MMETSP1360-20130828/6382_1 /ASSEMBLY_ACC=CAM_ASM_000848 /TAXON_ID=515479 /ORGANISM="Licmophora paradoxa, Strain CCMP2313" /LENGTH=35 /DNA_ID= /DNA_START= /DNA_END= /DNA_ORIENTATION=
MTEPVSQAEPGYSHGHGHKHMSYKQALMGSSTTIK